jgi:hypothetical protein
MATNATCSRDWGRVPVLHREIVARFEKADRGLLIDSLLFCMDNRQHCSVVLDHAQQLIRLSNRRAAEVEFSNHQRLEQFVTTLEEQGLSLPSTPPDWLYKPEAWYTSDEAKPQTGPERHR